MDVLATTVRHNLAISQVRRVVIDSSAEQVLATREWDRFPAYMRSLVAFARSVGSSLLVTSETTATGLAAQSMERLMFLFDNVIDLRYIEQESGLGRALNVVKMRNGAHQMTLNSVTITSHGLQVGGVLKGVTGRLGWSALRAQDPPGLHSSAAPRLVRSSWPAAPGLPAEARQARQAGRPRCRAG